MMDSQHDVTIDVASLRFAAGSDELIRDLFLRVVGGTFVSLIGPSGAGKTTLLRIIAGLEHRYQGQVLLGDRKITEPSRDVQVVFQDYCLLPWKTARGNIEFAMDPKEDRSGKYSVDELIDWNGLKDVENNYRLSGGEAARVAIARALVDHPKVLLLDEPFRNLDVYTKWRVQLYLMEALREIKTTVIMISHDIYDAVFLSDVVYVLGSEPTTVLFSKNVPCTRPRERTDPALREITDDLIREFVEAQPTSGARLSSGGVVVSRPVSE